MAEWSVLGSDAVSELRERGFAILPDAVPYGEMEQLAAVYYNRAVASATGDDISIGNTSTRVTDFVNRGAEFDRLYVSPPLLEACYRPRDGHAATDFTAGMRPETRKRLRPLARYVLALR